MEAQAISTIQSGVPFYLPINAGEKVTILGKDEDWLFCRNQQGMVGKIPTSFAKPTNEISTNKSSAMQPTFTPPLSPTLINKVQNGYFDDLYQNKNDTMNENISDLELDEIEGVNDNNNENKKLLSQTLMGQNIDKFINPNQLKNDENYKMFPNKKSQSEYKTQFIEDDDDNDADDDILDGLTLQNDDKNEEEEDEDNEDNENNDNLMNDKETMMGYAANNELLIFNENIDCEHGMDTKITLMGDINIDENEEIKFKFDENGDNIENEEEIEIINKGITLMGMNQNENINFIKLEDKG